MYVDEIVQSTIIVVTVRRRNSLLSLDLRMRMTSYKRTSNTSFSVRQPSMTGISNSNQEVSNKIQMILKAVGPLSRL